MKQVCALVLVVVGVVSVSGQNVGIYEKATDTTVRPRLTGVEAGVPAERGPFTFAAPYNTQGYRITVPSDCPVTRPDCVQPVGYSYWPLMSNSVDSNVIQIIAVLKDNGGATRFTLDKQTGVVTKGEALFSSTDSRRLSSGEGWYFSYGKPNALYVTYSSVAKGLQRVDVVSKTTETVFDVTTQFGAGHFIWQASTSNDDRVHAATLKHTTGYVTKGCVVYFEDTGAYQFFPTTDMNECHVDASGRWLVIKEQVDGVAGDDNRFINLQTGAETLLRDEDGAGGHSDLGNGVYLARDNWGTYPSIRLWKLWDAIAPPGQVVYRDPTWATGSANHISLTHASTLPIADQYACASDARTTNGPRSNEVVCFRLDGSLDVLTVAPVMTAFGTGSAGGDTYKQLPKGHLDATGEFFMWSTNLGTNRTDVIVVRVPRRSTAESTVW
jgi:hypothetical protein